MITAGQVLVARTAGLTISLVSVLDGSVLSPYLSLALTQLCEWQEQKWFIWTFRRKGDTLRYSFKDGRGHAESPFPWHPIEDMLFLQ